MSKALTMTLYTADDCTATWPVILKEDGTLHKGATRWDKEAFEHTIAVLCQAPGMAMDLTGDEWRALWDYGYEEDFYGAVLAGDAARAKEIVDEALALDD